MMRATSPEKNVPRVTAGRASLHRLFQKSCQGAT